MPATLKGTKTEKNLLISFAGESQARNRYTYASSKAKNEGYIQISAVFAETAEQEKEHAKRFYKFLEGNEVEITAAFPAGTIGDTLANLEAAAAGEHYENTKMYPGFAQIAREEGFEEIARVFENISIAEKNHEERYAGLAKNLKDRTIFKKAAKVKWMCRNCGYVHEGAEAPDKCPACLHPQAYFEILARNW